MAYNFLIVDDSKTIRAVIAKTLNVSGLDVGEIHEAENGRDGLEKLESEWIDLCFVDINMPVMDGMEMVVKMRESEMIGSVPVIVVSTEGSKSRIQELDDLGVSAYLRKPFTPESLRETVEKVLEKKMSDSQALDIFGNTLTMVLETMAFAFADEVDSAEDIAGEGSYFKVQMSFKGPFTGSVLFFCNDDLAMEVATNTLGTDPDDVTDPMKGDALKEMLNMACGQYLTARFGDDPVFDLSVPQIEQITSEQISAFTEKNQCLFYEVEDIHLLIVSIEDN